MADPGGFFGFRGNPLYESQKFSWELQALGLTGILGIDVAEVDGVIGRKGKCRCWGGKPGTDCRVCVCGSSSAHNNGCIVSGYGCIIKNPQLFH